MKRTVVGAIVLTLLLLLPASASAKTQLYTMKRERTDNDILKLDFDVYSKRDENSGRRELKYVEDFYVEANHGECQNGAPASKWGWSSPAEDRARIDTSDDNSFKFQLRGYFESYKFKGEIRPSGLAVGRFTGGYGYGATAGDHNCETIPAMAWGAKPRDD